MNVRLIKPGMSRPEEKPKQPAAEVPIIDTIRSWVRDFQTLKADRSRLDLEKISNTGKT